jgi:hypothetical protein
VNVFVCPGEVFDEIIGAPSQAANWRIPTLLVCLTGIVLLQVIAGHGDSSDVFGAVVKSAQITLAQAQELSGLRPLIAGLAICLSAFAGTFWSAFVLWFMGRVFLRTRFSYGKSLEVAGMASVILVLGTVITMLLIAASGNVQAHPALSFLAPAAGPQIHAFLEAMNFFHLWSTTVLAVGLSRLSGVSFKESAFWVFGYGIFARIALILLR